jgi:hypothetical protein
MFSYLYPQLENLLHRRIRATLLMVLVGVSLWFISSPFSALAAIDDDRFDGNIFALYAGNGSLVPSPVTLAESFQGERPTLVTYYLEDSSDCKKFSAVISEIQAYYGRVIDIIPVNVDSIPLQGPFGSTEPGAYYRGKIPQTVLFNAKGEKVLDVAGRADFQVFDDALRQVFDLLPRSESVELKRRRSLNEVNAELVK